VLRTELYLSFQSHVSTQTTTFGQSSGSIREAENICPSFELVLSKLERLTQGQLASMFIGPFKHCVCICVYVSGFLHPFGFPHEFETDIGSLVRKQAEGLFASSQFEF